MAKDVFTLVKMAHAASARISVRSALNPLLWFCQPTGILCIVLACYQAAGEIQSVILWLGVLLLIAPVVGFAYFAICNPDYLRSETYHIQKQSLEMLGDKSEQLKTTAEHVSLIANPQPRGEE